MDIIHGDALMSESDTLDDVNLVEILQDAVHGMELIIQDLSDVIEVLSTPEYKDIGKGLFKKSWKPFSKNFTGFKKGFAAYKKFLSKGQKFLGKDPGKGLIGKGKQWAKSNITNIAEKPQPADDSAEDYAAYCINCGTPFNSEERFCRKCGAKRNQV